MWKKVGSAMTYVGIDFVPVAWGFMAAFAESAGGVCLVLGIFFRLACLERGDDHFPHNLREASTKLREIIFVIGGCRSGKSRQALQIAHAFARNSKIFMATCIPCDDAMRQWVARHRQERSSAWQTVEAPILLPEAVTESGRTADAIVVDCLTLWISNLLMKEETPEKIDGQIRRLTAAIENAGCPVVLVSNDVGAGIVPDNRLARLFRDWVGFGNQTIAAMADKVILLVAGIPLTIKPK